MFQYSISNTSLNKHESILQIERYSLVQAQKMPHENRYAILYTAKSLTESLIKMYTTRCVLRPSASLLNAWIY